MFGDRIAEIATKIQLKYIENAAYWANINPTEMNLYESITKLAQDLHSEASSSTFDLKQTKDCLSKLAQVLTQDSGMTPFEFSKSGLLNSIQTMLT